MTSPYINPQELHRAKRYSNSSIFDSLQQASFLRQSNISFQHNMGCVNSTTADYPNQPKRKTKYSGSGGGVFAGGFSGGDGGGGACGDGGGGGCGGGDGGGC